LAGLKALGIEGIGRRRVASEMKKMGLERKTRKRFVATTDSKHVQKLAIMI
jgi:hypothetical protein